VSRQVHQTPWSERFLDAASLPISVVSGVSRSTHAPQGSDCDPLAGCEVLSHYTSRGLTRARRRAIESFPNSAECRIASRGLV
jgi:hypothetical protein